MKIAYLTLGCKLNYAETSTYERGFAAEGLQAVPWEEGADVFLVNTCSVTERADKKARNLIRKVHRISPEAKIIVTGCYAELQRDLLERMDGVSLVFGAREKNCVVPGTMALLRGENTGEGALGETFPAYSSGERTRSFLKVQDGCDNFCAYCTVPFARGRSRNLPISVLTAQAREIAALGVKEIVITGVNTGDFGKTTGESFLSLLQALDKVEGIERYRISSIEPNLITEEIIDWIVSGTKVQPHFHIPLQSGSDAILSSMGRRYDTALFADRIDFIRSRMEHPGEPKVFFGIDVIAGLPGETEERFRETFDFIKDRIRPAFLHIFPYSRRPGTRAASMGGQVREGIKTERVEILEDLCSDLHREFVESNRGLKARILWESDCKDGMMGGYTGNYIRKETAWDASRIGKIEEVTI